MTTFLFFRVTQTSSSSANGDQAAVTRGEPRNASFRSSQAPCAGSSCLRRFARLRYRVEPPVRAPRHDAFAPGRGGKNKNDVHGSLDRVKDVSANVEIACSASLRRVRAFCYARRRRSPPHSSRGHLLSPVRASVWERAPHQTLRTDQDPCFSGTPRRLPASRGSGCLPPMRSRERKRISSPRVPRRPLAHAAHTFSPRLGTMCLLGIASVTPGMIPGSNSSLLALRLRESRFAS